MNYYSPLARSQQPATNSSSAVGQIARDATAAATSSPWWTLYTAASIAGTALGAYHGYKRNDSIGWAIGWGLLGGAFPFITVPVAYAQGFGKRG